MVGARFAKSRRDFHEKVMSNRLDISRAALDLRQGELTEVGSGVVWREGRTLPRRRTSRRIPAAHDTTPHRGGQPPRWRTAYRPPTVLSGYSGKLPARCAESRVGLCA